MSSFSTSDAFRWKSKQWPVVTAEEMVKMGPFSVLIVVKGEEMEEKQQLEEQHRAVMDKYKYKRRQIRELQEDLQTMSHTLDNLCRDEDAYNELAEEKQNKILQVKDFSHKSIYAQHNAVAFRWCSATHHALYKHVICWNTITGCKSSCFFYRRVC